LLGDISDDIWSENNMEEAFVEEARELAQVDRNYVCVPIETNGLNNLFFCSIENGRQQRDHGVMSLGKRGREDDNGRRLTQPR
jgi:hypothetical protein